jgi:hypothetical protein
MAVLIPLANRLAQMPMPIDGKRDAALDEALRQVSARMIGGDALLMVACAAAVTISLIMPTYQTSLIALMVVVLPAAYVATALQPGNFVPRSLLRWLDGPRHTSP